MSTPKQNGSALRKIRKAQGITVREAARKSGVSPATIQALEKGESRPALYDYAEALNLKVELNLQ